LKAQSGFLKQHIPTSGDDSEIEGKGARCSLACHKSVCLVDVLSRCSEEVFSTNCWNENF